MVDELKDHEKYPPVRFPRALRDALQNEANDLARSRGKDTMSIADYVAEIRTAYNKGNVEPEEEIGYQKGISSQINLANKKQDERLATPTSLTDEEK